MISKDVIDKIRERTDIVSVVREHVPTLKQRGRSFTGLCPFHKEKSPSFGVNPDKGFFYCFGCKKGGSVVDFIMEVEGLTFPEAVRSLAERLGIEIVEDHSVDRSEDARKRRERDDLFAVNHLAAVYFEGQLRDHPQRSYAIDELQRRGLVPSWAGGMGIDQASQSRIDDTLQAFRIGYAPHGWDGLARYLKTSGVSLAAAEAVGLVVPRNDGSGYFDRFHHRLMFSVVDAQGRVLAFSGRALESPPDYKRAKPGERIAKYINSPESPIYTKGQTLFGLFQARHALLQSKDKVAVLVEGNFDVVSLHARGFGNVLAPLGTAVTKDQMKLLKSRASTAVFLFDADDAGHKGVVLGRDACREVGLVCKVARIAQGKDPDELVRSPGGVEKLQSTLDAAQGALEYMLEQLLDESFVAADAYERSERVQAAAKLLGEEDDPIVRSMAKTYADRLAGRLDLVGSADAFRALEESVRKSLRGVAPRREGAPTQLPSIDRHGSETSKVQREPAIDPRRARVSSRTPGASWRGAIVGALIDFPELLDDSEVCSALGVVEGLGALVVAALSHAVFMDESGKKSLDTARFLSQIPDAAKAFASQRLAEPRHATSTEAKTEVTMSRDRLERLALRQETDNAARSIDKLGDEGIALLRELNEKHRARHGLPPGGAPSGAVPLRAAFAAAVAEAPLPEAPLPEAAAPEAAVPRAHSPEVPNAVPAAVTNAGLYAEPASIADDMPPYGDEQPAPGPPPVDEPPWPDDAFSEEPPPGFFDDSFE